MEPRFDMLGDYAKEQNTDKHGDVEKGRSKIRNALVLVHAGICVRVYGERYTDYTIIQPQVNNSASDIGSSVNSCIPTEYVSCHGCQ